jgi:hypothetical protein
MILESCVVLCAVSGLVAAGVSVWSVRDLSTRVGLLERAGRVKAIPGYPEALRRSVSSTSPGPGLDYPPRVSPEPLAEFVGGVNPSSSPLKNIR